MAICLFCIPLLTLLVSGRKQEPVYENLGPQINTKYEELHPYITPDGNKLFFVRCDDPANTLSPQHTQDIWYSKLEGGNWTQAKHLGKPFNKTWYNSIFYQSPDGNMRMIRGAFRKGSFQGAGYSVTYLTRNGWSEPEQIRVKKYEKHSKSKSSGICVGNDNKTMLLYLGNNTQDIHDLYVSFLEGENSWSEPEPLGPDVNTDADETTPFLAADGVTLYFSSNRAGGYGSNDIYMTRRLDDSWKKWSTPVNLGPTVNSAYWDAYYTIPASADFAYMVSQKNSYGGSDLVRIKLNEEIKPNPVILITGQVLDAKTNLPVEAKISYDLLPGGKEAGIASSHPTNGEYQIVLPYGKFYGYKAEAPGYYPVSENMDLRDLSEYKEMVQNLYLIPVNTGEVVRLNNIFFETGKWDLKEESFVELDEVVKFLNSNPAMEIALGGHTDNVGADEANLRLSENRAKAVLDYVVSKGIAAERISSKGYGETKPLTGNETEEGRQKNRRVEFTIVKK